MSEQSEVGHLTRETLRDAFRVIENRSNEPIRMGYTGRQIMDAGFFYAPYVPLHVSPSINVNEFTPSRGIMSRYGQRMLEQASQYYSTFRIGDPELPDPTPLDWLLAVDTGD